MTEWTRRALLLALAGRAGAQTAATFSTDVKVVNLFATVRNKKGEIIRDLAKEDFSLTEDDRPQVIQYFSHESNLPLTLGLLVDTSGSQRRVLAAERSASFRFLGQVLRPDQDLAFIIHFDREVELLQDFTASREKLERALDGMGPSRGRQRGPGTILYDAVALASDDLMRKQAGRKAVIILSDGVDTGSKLSLSTCIEAAQRADTLVYSILFADPAAYGGRGAVRMGGRGRRGRTPIPASSGRMANGKKVLQRIAQETGGGFFEVSHKMPIESVYDRIQEELRNQYSLGYVSDQSSEASGFRKIRLAARGKTLVVQTRDGYYAGRP